VELGRCLLHAREPLAGHGFFCVAEDRDRIEVALLEELSHSFWF
jgi:hypothetical protein